MVLTTKDVSYCDGAEGAVSVSVAADPQALRTSANDAAHTRGRNVTWSSYETPQTVHFVVSERPNRYNISVNNRSIEVVGSFAEAAQADKEYWLSQTPHARLQHALELRRMNYGTDRVSSRLQRVLEITQRTPR